MPQGYYDGSYGYQEVLRVSAHKRVGINDASPDSVLTIKGETNASDYPSIRLKDGTDSREVSITNTSGDFVAYTHGTDNNSHGHIKMFESGAFQVANGGSSGSSVSRLHIETSGKFDINSQAEFAANVISNVNQNTWYDADPLIRWGLYSVVGAIIMVTYEDNNADGHNLGAYFVGPATSAYAGATATPFHRFYGSGNLEVQLAPIGSTSNRKLQFRCTHSSATGISTKLLRWTILRSHRN